MPLILQANKYGLEIWQIITYFLLLRNKIKQLSTSCVLKDNENVRASVNELEVFDDVGMVEASQNFDLSLHFLENALHFDFAFVKNLDGDMVPCNLVYRHYNSVKC